MSYKDKPIIKLYKWENNSFVMQAQIDDFQEVSFEHTIYQAGTFTITINYNIPNALKFERGLFVQIGNNPYDFGEIITIQDSIGEDGKGSQTRTITGYDARYILKRRVIKNMNSNGLWVMTDKGELVLRTLIKDQCGAGAEAKRQLPITNTIPASSSAIGKDYSVSEQFSNLYEVCKTIATQSEIGWRFAFDGSGLTLEVYEGTDRSQTVKFDTSFESLANGDFTDSSDSFSNAIYVGGKGQNDDRDIYEGEDVSAGTPSGLDRFESWDNQSAMTIESEYEAEALSMLTQYGQTLTMSGNGLAKCPYVFREEYDIGDSVTVAFSGKSAVAQILSITEHWSWGAYDIQFSFGKPQNNLADQLQLMLRKIQDASNKTNSTDSVRWYTIPTDTAMPKADVTYNTIGFVGTVDTGATFTLYLDDYKTGAKTYHVYFKQLGGTGKLTLTTGKAGATDLTLNAGTYVAIIYVDENGNVTNTASTPTSTIEAGNTQPATSGGVQQAISDYDTLAPYTTVTDANLCIPELMKEKRYLLGSSASNVPVTSGGIILLASRQYYSTQVYQSIFQIAYQQGTSEILDNVYIRQAWSDNSGTSWTWGSWEKLETEGIIFNKTGISGNYFLIAEADISSTSVPYLNADIYLFYQTNQYNTGTVHIDMTFKSTQTQIRVIGWTDLNLNTSNTNYPSFIITESGNKQYLYMQSTDPYLGVRIKPQKYNTSKLTIYSVPQEQSTLTGTVVYDSRTDLTSGIHTRENNSYVLGETATGAVYINGKPIYRRVSTWSLANLPTGTSTHTFTSSYWSDIEDIIDIKVIRPKTSTLLSAVVCAGYRYDPATKTLNVYGNSVDWTGPFLLIFEYTKP